MLKPNMNKLKILSGILTSVSCIGYSGITDQTSTDNLNESKIVKVVDHYKDITAGYCYFRIPV